MMLPGLLEIDMVLLRLTHILCEGTSRQLLQGLDSTFGPLTNFFFNNISSDCTYSSVWSRRLVQMCPINAR